MPFIVASQIIQTLGCTFDKGKNSDLPVAPAVDGADGQTEPCAAWDVHHVEEFQPLIPARVVGLHFLGDLRLTQSFRSVIDTCFHINLQRRSFLCKSTNIIHMYMYNSLIGLVSIHPFQQHIFNLHL